MSKNIIFCKSPVNRTRMIAEKFMRLRKYISRTEFSKSQHSTIPDANHKYRLTFVGAHSVDYLMVKMVFTYWLLWALMKFFPFAIVWWTAVSNAERTKETASYRRRCSGTCCDVTERWNGANAHMSARRACKHALKTQTNMLLDMTIGARRAQSNSAIALASARHSVVGVSSIYAADARHLTLLRIANESAPKVKFVLLSHTSANLHTSECAACICFHSNANHCIADWLNQYLTSGPIRMRAITYRNDKSKCSRTREIPERWRYFGRAF